MSTLAPVSGRGGIAWDNINNSILKSWDELFGMDPPEVEAFQLAALKQRVEELKPKVKQLAAQVDAARLASIEQLEDAVPLLFSASAYKSYPISLIENRRFELLTRWLDGITSLDLAAIDTSGCRGIDAWLDAVEKQSELRPYHTSGTSGKISFIPRSKLETIPFRGSPIAPLQHQRLVERNGWTSAVTC
jgi:hypothetical protein